jgi:acyl transferase domain-containing protein
MDEAPAYLASHKMKAHHNSLDNTPHVNGVASRDFFDPEYHLFCFSSNEKSGVKRVMDSHLQYIENAETTLPSDFLENYSYTLGCRRSNMEWKGAIVAKSTEQLSLKMKSIDQSSFTRSSRDKPPRIGFVFCGQGSQWAGMGKDLISFAAFRESLEAASYFTKIYLGSSFNLLEEIFRAENESRISDADISQPATTALQVALVDLLSAFSIKPSHVVGHSSGEIAAAYASGAISRETAWEVAYFRGQTAASISVKAPKLKGGMVAAGMSLTEAEVYLESLQNSLQASVQVACINSPRSVTLSGQADAISFIADDLRQRGVFNRVLPVSTAYHSEHMKLVEHDYQNRLVDIKCGDHRPGVTMLSSVTGSAVTGNELGASYWVANMLSPVQYVKAVQAMMGSPAAKRPNIIVELSPRPSLRTPTSDIVDGMSITTTLLSVLQRNVEGEMSLLQTVGDLWTQGCLINMKYAATRGEVKVPKCLVDLPPYPWNHSKLYWHESHLGEANRFRKYPRQDLIGAPTADSISFEPRWRGFLRVSENPWIQDHQVQKTIVYPAAGMISMVLEGAKQMTTTGSALLGYEICNMKIEKAMIVPSTAHGLEMALNIKEDMEMLNGGQLLGSREFAIYSKQLNGPWERNASGLLRFRYADGNWKAILEAQKATHDAASANCRETLVPRQLYELLDTVGMNYGSLFQNIVDIRKGGDSCVSKIRIPDTKSKMPAQFEYPHVLHPAALDSMFQTLFALEPVPMVPTFIESLFVSAELGDMGPDDYFTGCSTARRIGLGDAEADITMRLRESSSYIMIRGLRLTALGSSASDEGGFLPNHRKLCTNIAWSEDVTYAKPSSLVEFVRLWAHKYPGVSILDVGGVCSSTLATLDSLSPPEGETSRLFRYAIADLGDSCAALTLKHLADTPLAQIVESVKIDGSEPLPDFDLILMHLDCPIESDHLTKHLKAAGRLLRYSNIESTAVIESMSYPNIGQTQTQELPLEITILYPDFSRIEILGFANRVEERFVSQGLDNVVFSKLSLREAARDPSAMAGKVVFSLLDFGRDDEGGFFFQMEQENFELFHTIQRIAKGIFWVTQSAHMDCQDPRNSPVIALARTLMSEDPLKIIVTLDLDLESVLDSEAVHSAIVYILSRTFVEASGSWPREMEYAARGGKLYIPRLTTIDPLNQLIENNGGGSTFETAFRTNRLENSPSTGLRLSITKPGLANDGMHFEEFEHDDLGPLDVEVAFERSDLSFKDLDTASGRTRDSTVGLDVFGHIVRKGSSVESLKTGSSVMALVSGGSFQSSVIADSRFVAATRPGFVPSSFLSAYYAIVHVGRAGPRRKVLVHAGASSYGLAAIQLCLIVGADVFATVIGNESDEQRARLERAGVPSDHIINGNSESLTHVVLNMTSGKGVDVVYNPTQEHVELNASCVRRCKFSREPSGMGIEQS